MLKTFYAASKHHRHQYVLCKWWSFEYFWGKQILYELIVKYKNPSHFNDNNHMDPNSYDHDHSYKPIAFGLRAI